MSVVKYLLNRFCSLDKFATHLNDLCTFDAFVFSNYQICTQIYTIANLLPSQHLHFGTELKMHCKSDFHPVSLATICCNKIDNEHKCLCNNIVISQLYQSC